MVNGISSQQCRMARAALGWSQQDLAARSGVGSTSIKKFELGTSLRPVLLGVLRSTLESAGVGFIDEGARVADVKASFGVYVRFGTAIPDVGRGSRDGRLPDERRVGADDPAQT